MIKIQNSKRLPKNSITVIFAFPNSEKLDEFMESDEYKDSIHNLESLATAKFELRKIEKIPYKL